MATDTASGISGSATVTVRAPATQQIDTSGVDGKGAETWESFAPTRSATDDTPFRPGDSPQARGQEPCRVMRLHPVSDALVEIRDQLFIDEAWIG